MTINILYIPLDERPCNSRMPVMQFPPSAGFRIFTPPPRLLNRKKSAAPYGELWDWVEKTLPLCRRGVLSMEMLLYGGLLPSRLHQMDSQELAQRVERLKNLLQGSDCSVSAFSLIMRTPCYNSADEEPDYWERWGEKIYRRSCLLEEISPDPSETSPELQSLDRLIPREYVEDYELRRRRNLRITEDVIRLYRQGLIRNLVIPQDDSAPCGYTAMERKALLKNNPDILTYPGADEVGAVLLCQAALSLKEEVSEAKRQVCILYDQEENSLRKPNYEGIPLDQSLPLQVQSGGGVLCPDPEKADLILAVQTVDPLGRESWEQQDDHLSRDMPSPFAEEIEAWLRKGKAVALADVKFSNGGDRRLVRQLGKDRLFKRLAAYSAWNTAGNTIGTALARGLTEVNWPHEQTRLTNLRYHYWDDLIYQTRVRRSLLEEEIPRKNLSYFDLTGQKEEMAAAARIRMSRESSALEELVGSPLLPGLQPPEVSFPWNRLFEISLIAPLSASPHRPEAAETPSTAGETQGERHSSKLIRD